MTEETNLRYDTSIPPEENPMTAKLSSEDMRERGIPLGDDGYPDIARAPFEVKLIEPVEFGKKAYASLTFGRFRAALVRQLREDRAGIENILAVAAAAAGVPNQVVDQLGQEDFRTVLAIGNAYLGRALGR